MLHWGKRKRHRLQGSEIQPTRGKLEPQDTAKSSNRPSPGQRKPWKYSSSSLTNILNMPVGCVDSFRVQGWIMTSKKVKWESKTSTNSWRNWFCGEQVESLIHKTVQLWTAVMSSPDWKRWPPLHHWTEAFGRKRECANLPYSVRALQCYPHAKTRKQQYIQRCKGMNQKLESLGVKRVKTYYILQTSLVRWLLFLILGEFVTATKYLGQCINESGFEETCDKRQKFLKVASSS